MLGLSQHAYVFTESVMVSEPPEGRQASPRSISQPRPQLTARGGKAILWALDDLACQLDGPDGAILVVTMPVLLDHDSAETLLDAIHGKLPQRDDAAAVLDMTEIRMISSIGIAALLQVRELCQDRGAGLVLASVPEQQLEFLRLLRLDRTFEVVASVADAIARLNPPG